MSIKDLFRIKDFKEKIYSLTERNQILEEELRDASNRNEELKRLLDVKNSSNATSIDVKFKEVDIDAFCTNEYKTEFANYINDNVNHSLDDVFIKFNQLINEELIYFAAIISCIDFIRTKRNRKLSTEKQIVKYMLTKTGRDNLDSFIEATATREDINNE